MDSFADLGVPPELVEALAAEGIERPTPLQQAAIPVLRRGNNLVLTAGPGSGLLVTWAVGLLSRPIVHGDAPAVLVLTGTGDVAERLAESTARLADAAGHTVAALSSAWARPARARMVFATPGNVLRAHADGALPLNTIETVVIDQAGLLATVDALDQLEQVLDHIGPDAQRVLSALPVTGAVRDFAERHVRRAVALPSDAQVEGPRRGSVRMRIVAQSRETAAADVAAGLLEDGARHVLVFCASDDRAADVGDYLTLRGFPAGAPGDGAAPVWLGVDPLEARAQAARVEGLVVVSCDVPLDPDSLDRRHSISPNGVVVALTREVAHVKDVAKRTGYGVEPFPPPRRADDEIGELRATIERALDSEDTAPYLAALEPLFARHDPAEVAAATVALLRKSGPELTVTARPAERAARAPSPAPSWAKLFLGVGARDGLRPGDVLGAITGEAGVGGDAVGRIDIKESHSLVEVHEAVAHKVIDAINGTTIKGRAVRADYDRPRRGGARGRSRS